MKSENANNTTESMVEKEALRNDSPTNQNLEVVKFEIEEVSSDDIRNEIRSVKKTLALIWVCCVMCNSPTFALISSASSLLNDEGLGVASLAASGSAQFLAAAVLLSYVTKFWGIRNVLRVAFWLPAFYIVSFLYPHWGTTIIAGFLLGLGQGSLTAMFMYGYALAYYYARLTKTNVETIIVFIAGGLGSSLGAAVLFGNLLLYLILKHGSEDKISIILPESSNDTNSSGDASHDICGARYCNEGITQLDNVELPAANTYYMMVGLFFALAASGGTLSFFIRDFGPQFGYSRRKKSEFLAIVKETWLLLKDPRGYLLVAITVFIGLEEGFIMSEYTQAYVSCILGIPTVGLIIFAYGGTLIIASLVQGYLVKYFGRILVILLGITTLMCIFTTLLLWQPTPDQVVVFFVISVLWSSANGILFPAAFGMYGILFEDNIEGSVSLAAFWWSLGYTISFLWSQFLCVYVKLYIIMVVGCIGVLAYLLLEYLMKQDSFKKGRTFVQSKN